jgi:hypothetical protein
MAGKHLEEMVKCTVKLPASVWREARIRALDERRDFQDVVAEAIELYLKRPKTGAKKE